jgi:hypothetical protein
MTRRHNVTAKRRANTPEALAASLPDELRSFEGWYYPQGLQDYMRELSRFVGEDQRLSPVMNTAGLSAAGWFRHMLTDGTR